MDAARKRRLAALAERVSAVLLPCLAFVALMTVWEVWVRVGNVSPHFLPPPSKIAGQLGIFSQIWPNLWTTLQRVLYGYLLSVGIGFTIAVGIAMSRPVARALYPIVIGLQLIPKLAVAPLFLVWFGYGGKSTILIVFMLAFFPIVINTTLGLRSTDVETIYLARSVGASRIDTFVKMRLPNALPSIFGGLKLSALLSVSGAVVAEFISATNGIGVVLQTAAGNADLVRLLVAVGYLSAFGLAFFMFMELLERLTIPWHVSRRGYTTAPQEAAV
jgi:NitT/TauT family transport system permease protein